MSHFALIGARIFTGAAWLEDHAICVEGGCVAALIPRADLPHGMPQQTLDGGLLVPGFVDVQVNGGGGVLFNDAPTVETLATMAQAHQRFGTTALLPTLISDTPEAIRAAIDAVRTAIRQGVPGIAGIHIEGPYLNRGKAGIHDPARFLTLDEGGIDLLASLGPVGVTMVTLAPECCAPGTIAALRARGVHVSAGHSLAGYEAARAAFDEGVSGATHLFNAMSQLESRAPGLTGAALLAPGLICGLIADGRHVHPAAMQLAYRLRGPSGLALVTDAMTPTGTDMRSFSFGGQTIHVEGSSCVAVDGTLAGSNLTMDQAVRNAVTMIGAPLVDALVMASTTPARWVGLGATHGRIQPGYRADFVHLDDALAVQRTWIGGND